ncbi:MAG: hypothetical protein ACKVPX_13420 [Myxococcaceae bacterium]
MNRRPPKSTPVQLSFSFDSPAPRRVQPEDRQVGPFRVISGGGEGRSKERLDNPDAVVRALLESGVDLLLRKITPERAREVERAVGRIMKLFDEVREQPRLRLRLAKEIEGLERLMQESRNRKRMR